MAGVAPSPPVDAAPAPLVVLTDPHITADAGASPPALTLTAVLTNHLPVALTGVEVGVLLAEDASRLAQVDAGRLYAKGGGGGVSVLRRKLPLAVPAGGSGELRVVAPASAATLPAAFEIHLLGYALARARADVLFRLIASGVPAAEVAAVDALAIGGTVADERRVRARLAGDDELRAALAKRVAAAIPDQPSIGEVRARLFALLGLGILGGTRARETLEKAALAALDEPLQIVRAARLTGTRDEAPLAHALPAAARTMADVVALALANVDGWPDPAPPPAARKVQFSQRSPLDSLALELAVALAVALVVFVATYWLLRRLMRH